MIDGGLIIVTVLEIQGGRVRLGIEAPTDIPVHRQEHRKGGPTPAPEQKVA